MKIFANVQTSHVAGISRVMNSFSEYVTSPHSDGPVELIYASLAAEPSEGGGWQETSPHAGERMLVYAEPMPNFGEVIRNSAALDDVRAAYRGLTEAFRQKLKEEKPDIVLANGTYFVPWCLVMAARSLRLPVVLYYHGSLTKETEHWRELESRRLLMRMEASFDRADIRYIFPSALIKEYVESQVFRRPLLQRNVAVLPNPIPEAFFKAQARKSKRRIGFVGRWTRVKNTAFLVRLAEINRKAGSPLDIHVLTDHASRKNAARVLHDRVRFAQPRARSVDLAKFYAQMGAVICPSYFETYGNVAQEAVAAGTLAFVSRNMGVAEMFERVGLDDLILDFDRPREVFRKLQSMGDLSIPAAARRALRKEASPGVVHKKLLDYLKN